MKRIWILALCACLVSVLPVRATGKSVLEPASEIPLAYDVDVLVVGGASAGVAAALEARRQGANVMVIEERPYLGQDLCGPYRLWLEPGEEPKTDLARRLFDTPDVAVRTGRGVPFEYETSLRAADKHPDRWPPSLLTDGKYHDAPSQSVQYDGDVTITATIAKTVSVARAHVMVYQRPDDFEIARIKVSISPDKQNWRQVAVIENDKLDDGTFDQRAIPLVAQIGETTRYLRFDVEKTPEVSRVLLGEIVIEAENDSTDAPERMPVMVTPMQVKRTLDLALLDADIPFLFTCFGAQVLRDEQGLPAGVVFTDKSGRQAIRAKVIVDATLRASLARNAGAQFRPYPAGEQLFKRIVVGPRQANEHERIRSTRVLMTCKSEKTDPTVNATAIEYTLSLPMKDGSWASFAEADQMARDITWARAQADSSEILFQVPPDSMKGRRRQSGWRSAAGVDLDAFRPAGVQRIYVAGPCADISRDAAAEMLRPLNMLAIGERIGAAAAKEAKNVRIAGSVRLPGDPTGPMVSGRVRELFIEPNLRDRKIGEIPAGRNGLPVLGEYDVVVVGGGTGGAPAAISAAREGANTLLIEYLHGLGGVGTLGLISSYYHGNRVGFTSEIDHGVAEIGGEDKISGRWNVEWKMEWYRRQARRAGAEIWYGALGAAAVVENDRVAGVVVATPDGRGVVLAKMVVDSTGNAAIAAAAGAECQYVDSSSVAMQGTGLPPRDLGAGYTNTDYTFIDDLDTIDIWRSFVLVRKKYENQYDHGQLIDTRERRRIIGDLFIDPLDIWNHRTWPDTINIARSNFDTHGYTIHPVFTLRPPDREDIDVNVPYRALLPKGLDGVIVTGLGASAHRDAMPVIRMQPDIQNQGYAMGAAAAMLAREGKSTRELDVRALQKKLVEKDILPERVLTETDSFPIPDEKIAAAVRTVVNDWQGIQTVLVDTERAMPMLQEAYRHAELSDHKVVYGHILGILGDDTGVEALAEAVKNAEWDKGWRYTGMGQFGMSMSRVDSLIVALGRTGDRRALRPILDKLAQLDAESEFSHHRAVAVALENLGDPAAAKPLYDLLGKRGMTGHSYLNIHEIMPQLPSSSTDTSTRNRSLTELVLARALYRCGDYQGRGEKILRQYAKDFRGVYSKHAQAVLAEAPGR